MPRIRRSWLWLTMAGAFACGETPATTNPFDPRSNAPVEADLQVRIVLPADDLGDLTAPAARLAAFDTITARLEFEGLSEASSRQGEAHHFRVAPGTYLLRIAASSPALIVPVPQVVELGVAEKKTLTLDLNRRAAVVQGRILPPQGEPLPDGLRVDLRWAADASDRTCARGGDLGPATVSGDAWRAVVPTPISGRVCVVVQAPGHATVRSPAHLLAAQQSEDSDDIRLRTPDIALSQGTVDVRVFGESGADPTDFAGPPGGDVQISSRLVLLAIEGPPGLPMALDADEADGAVCGRGRDMITRVAVDDHGDASPSGPALTRPIASLDETLGALSMSDCVRRYPTATAAGEAAGRYIADHAAGDTLSPRFARFYCMVDPGPGQKTLRVTLETACGERFSGEARVQLLGPAADELTMTIEGATARDGRRYAPSGRVRLAFGAGGETADEGCVGVTATRLGARPSPLLETVCDRMHRSGIDVDLQRAFACDGGVDPCTGLPCAEAPGGDDAAGGYCEQAIRFDATWLDTAGRSRSTTQVVIAVRGTPHLELRGAGTRDADGREAGVPADAPDETFHEAPCPIKLPDEMNDCVAETTELRGGVEIAPHHRGLLMMKVQTDARGVDGAAPFSVLEVLVERETPAGWRIVEDASGVRRFTVEPFSVSPDAGQLDGGDGRYRVVVSALDRFGERVQAGELTVELDRTHPDISESGFLTCADCGDGPRPICGSAGDGCAACIGPGFAVRSGPTGAPTDVVVPADAPLPIWTPNVAEEPHGTCAWARPPADVDDGEGGERPRMRLCAGVSLMEPPPLDDGESGPWFRALEPFDVACNIGDGVALRALRDGTPPVVRMADDRRPEVELSCAVRTGPLCADPADGRLDDARWDVSPERCRPRDPEDGEALDDAVLPALARLSFELADAGTAELRDGGIRYRALAVPAPADGPLPADMVAAWLEPMLARPLCTADAEWGPGRAAPCPRQDPDSRCGCVSPDRPATLELSDLEVIGPGGAADPWRADIVGPCDDGAPIAVRLFVLLEDAVGNRIARLEPLIDRYCPPEDDCEQRRYRVFVDPDVLDTAPPEVAAARLESPSCVDDAVGPGEGGAGAGEAADAGVSGLQLVEPDNCELRE